MNRKPIAAHKLSVSILLMILAVSAGSACASEPAAGEEEQSSAAARCDAPSMASPYIPVDSWIYPAMYRLYSLGFVDTVYLNMRPWTRTSVLHMLEETEDYLDQDGHDPDAEPAREIYQAVMRELQFDVAAECGRHAQARIESAYTVFRGTSGTPLRDSFHLGSTIVNDYGRPYQGGFNNYTGVSGYATAGRFSLYARGEFQRAPSANGYSQDLATALATIDHTYGAFPPENTNLTYYNQATIPLGPISSTTQGRVLEATVSANLLNHEISFGKQDVWNGPAQGGAMSYSNNAENIYSFRINRVEPLEIPLLSKLTGPFRYEFLVGALQGHPLIPNSSYPASPGQMNVTNPGNPWVHVEKISFRPTRSLEFGLSRTVVWGGKGHAPITLHSFLKSFFSTTNVSSAEKFGRDDPGARFSQMDFSYRLPSVLRWITLYTDSEARDDIFSISAPRRAAWRPGIYMARVPGLPRLDIRVEGAITDPPHSRSNGGLFMYYEGMQKQAYTNQGQLFGDWMGREGKGGQAWLTYHLSGNEWVQVNYRRQKTAKDFIKSATAEYGTTLDDVGVQAVKRIGKDFEINGSFTLEHYNAPILQELNNMSGKQTVTSTSVQLTWYPGRKVSF